MPHTGYMTTTDTRYVLLSTPRTPDYVGTLRHACPECDQPAAVRRLSFEGKVTLYCSASAGACGWERVYEPSTMRTPALVQNFVDWRVAADSDPAISDEYRALAFAVIDVLRDRNIID